VPPPPPPAAQATEDIFATCRGTVAALAEKQTAVAGGIRALMLEMSDLARSNLIAAAESASALAGARTLADATEIQFAFARRSIDTMAVGAKRLSEIGMRLTHET
jgi:hypothetical protein